MKIVIDIPDENYKRDNLIHFFGCYSEKLDEVIKNGTPLPKGHGRLIDADGLKENINGWYAFMKDICKQPYMTLKQEEIIGKIDIMTPIIEADKGQEDGINK